MHLRPDNHLSRASCLAVTAHCDSALYRLQARVPVLLSSSPRAYCVRLLVQKSLAGQRSVEDPATCWLCYIIVTG